MCQQTIFLLVLLQLSLVQAVTKLDYKLKRNQDPEVDMDCAGVIRYWGYPVEQYDVITEDGYILTIFRIPHGRNEPARKWKAPKPVVFLQHGLESSSFDWVANLPNEAGGFVFADSGMDVWLGNFRGNTYGTRHTKLSPEQHEFWRFSWDEMAEFDLPAMINTALNISNVSTVYYIGHSMGTTTAFAKLSHDKEFAKQITIFYALSPVTTVRHIKGPLRLIAPFTAQLASFFRWIGYDDFLPNKGIIKLMAEFVCSKPVLDRFCEDVTFLICGPESNQINVTRAPVYISHSPAGTSSLNIAHFGQMVKSGKFAMYDFGKTQNRIRYGQDTPPEYDVSQVDVPIYLFWGGSDWLADQKDVGNLIPKLRRLIGNVYLPDFNHLDPLLGLRAAAEIYLPIVHDIKHRYYG